jgi:hypothetical protein
VQGAVVELETLAVFQSGGFCTEIKTFCVLFFVNEMKLSSRDALRRILNFTMGSSQLGNMSLLRSFIWQETAE